MERITQKTALLLLVASFGIPMGDALAQEGKFDVKGGFFQKNAATDGLIEGADLGGRPRRDLSPKQTKGQLRGRANIEAIRHGLAAVDGAVQEGLAEESQPVKRDSFAIVPTVDDKGVGAASDSFAYTQRGTPPSQAAPAPAAAPQAEPDAVTEGRSEEILNAVQSAQEGVKALSPGSPAPGTPEYTQRLIDQVKSESEWRDRSAERRKDVSGNRF